jgi:hypothetical protein
MLIIHNLVLKGIEKTTILCSSKFPAARLIGLTYLKTFRLGLYKSKILPPDD